jgi:hypothetical protein
VVHLGVFANANLAVPVEPYGSILCAHGGGHSVVRRVV